MKLNPNAGDTFNRITELLGADTVLLPIPHKKKCPCFKGWQQLTPDQTQADGFKITYSRKDISGNTTSQDIPYKQALQQGNIGVLLGKPSNGVCSIDIDDDRGVEPFIRLNPNLQATLRSKGRRGCNLWVRIRGEVPKTHKLKTGGGQDFGEWRADGGQTVISGVHPSGCDYQILNQSKPITIRFNEIKWPADLVLPWKQTSQKPASENSDFAALKQNYGAPYYTTEQGGVRTINERFWAGLYALENRIIYDSSEKYFYRYDTSKGLWTRTSPESLREAVSSRMLKVSKELSLGSLENKITVHNATQIVSGLKGVVEKRGVFNDKRSAIHVSNGMLRFQEDGDIQFTDFSPEYYSRNQSPITYDSEAPCPRFLSEFLEPALTPEDILLVQKWVGLALFGQNLPQRLLILDGKPNTGKSTLVLILQALIGEENVCQLRTECLAERFELNRFRGKTLLIGCDVPGDFLMKRGASVLKSLVGGDPLSVEAKGLNNAFQVKGDFNVVITCNSRLRVRLDGDVGAWKRRLLIVRYDAPPPQKRIQHFDGVLLKEEGSGMLNWALLGFARLKEDLRETGDFALSENQHQRIDGLLAESDSLRKFLTERVVRDEESDLTGEEIKSAYAEFCGDSGWNPLPNTLIERQLQDLMLELFHTTRSNSIKRDERALRGWRKVRLNQ